MKEMDKIQINQKRSSFKKRIRKELERNEYYGNQKPKVPTEFKFNFPKFSRVFWAKHILFSPS